MAKHLLKGCFVSVEGKLKQQRWEKDGQKLSRVVIKVRELHTRPTNNNNQDNSQQNNNGQQNNYQQQSGNNFAPAQTGQNNYGGEIYQDEGTDFVPFNEDIPF